MKNFTDDATTVVIGKYETDGDEYFGSVMVDELTLWDRQLVGEEVAAIAGMG